MANLDNFELVHARQKFQRGAANYTRWLDINCFLKLNKKEKKKKEEKKISWPDVAESNKPPLPPPVLTYLGRGKFWKSEGASSIMVSIIYPLPGYYWVNWSVKISGMGHSPPAPMDYGAYVSERQIQLVT